MPNQFSHPWTDNEITYIETNIGTLTYEEMGKTLNRSYSSIQSKVRFLPFQKKVKKYSINSFFFKKWSPSMAYILGLIAADGNVYRTDRAHVLHLASDDLDVLEKIKPILSYEGKIHQKKRDNGKISYSLRICDKTLFNDLVSLNITERKSLTLIPPPIPSPFIHHFIRGYFDGDGSVCLNNKNYPSRLVAIFYTASFDMANFLFDTINHELNGLYKGKIITRLAHGKTTYFSITLGHKAAQKLHNYMYKDSNGLYIKRKYDKFIEGMEYYARFI